MYISIYIERSWHHIFCYLSRCIYIYIEIYRVGDNRTNVNTTSPHISDWLVTENAC